MDQVMSPASSSCCRRSPILVRSMWLIGLIFCSALLFSAPSTTQTAAAAVDVNDSSVCQNLVPSPRLEQFVDELPRLKTILVNNRKQVTLGAYKIKQVRDVSSSIGPACILDHLQALEQFLLFEYLFSILSKPCYWDSSDHRFVLEKAPPRAHCAP